MASKGRLTLEKLGYSMPVRRAGLSGAALPLSEREALSIKFETDPDAALEILPEPLELPSRQRQPVLLLVSIHALSAHIMKRSCDSMRSTRASRST